VLALVVLFFKVVVFLADLDRVRNAAVSGLSMDLVSNNSSPVSLVSPWAATCVTLGSN